MLLNNFTHLHVSKQADSLLSLQDNMSTKRKYNPNDHRLLNTWYTIHNDNQWIVFEYEWVFLMFQMTQNSKLLNLTTKATLKQCKYYSKTVTNLTILIIHAPVHDGKTGSYL